MATSYSLAMYKANDYGYNDYEKNALRDIAYVDLGINPVTGKGYENLANATGDYLLSRYGYGYAINNDTSNLINDSYTKAYIEQQIANQNNFTNNFLKPALYGIQGIATLGNLWLGFKQYDIAKDQLKLAKEQWAYTKEEMDRIRNVKERIAQKFRGEL